MTVKEPGKLIARIDYPGSNGLVGDWVEYRDEAKFLADLKKENYYGVPLCVVLYRGRDGKTIYYSLADGHVRSIMNQGLEHIEE